MLDSFADKRLLHYLESLSFWTDRREACGEEELFVDTYDGGKNMNAYDYFNTLKQCLKSLSSKHLTEIN